MCVTCKRTGSLSRAWIPPTNTITCVSFSMTSFEFLTRAANLLFRASRLLTFAFLLLLLSCHNWCVCGPHGCTASLSVVEFLRTTIMSLTVTHDSFSASNVRCASAGSLCVYAWLALPLNAHFALRIHTLFRNWKRDRHCVILLLLLDSETATCAAYINGFSLFSSSLLSKTVSCTMSYLACVWVCLEPINSIHT